jgi:hypothetical protein
LQNQVNPFNSVRYEEGRDNEILKNKKKREKKEGRTKNNLKQKTKNKKGDDKGHFMLLFQQ